MIERNEMMETIANLKIDSMTLEEKEQFIFEQMLLNLEEFDNDVLEAIMEDLQK